MSFSPCSGCYGADVTSLHARHFSQHISKIVVRINFVNFAGCNNGVKSCGPPSSSFTTSKVPIVAPDSNRPNLLLYLGNLCKFVTKLCAFFGVVWSLNARMSFRSSKKLCGPNLACFLALKWRCKRWFRRVKELLRADNYGAHTTATGDNGDQSH